MTEVEWLAGEDPQVMLEYLRGTASNRKLRLFAIESVQPFLTLMTDPRSRNAVSTAEQFLDGNANAHQLTSAYRQAWDVLPHQSGDMRCVNAARMAGRTVQAGAYEAAEYTANEVREHRAEEREERAQSEEEEEQFYWEDRDQANRDLAVLLRCIFGNPFRPVAFDPRWRSETAVALATGIYDLRAFDRLPILADALEDAGCDSLDLLNHLRGPGPHARGCWAVDVVLGRM